VLQWRATGVEKPHDVVDGQPIWERNTENAFGVDWYPCLHACLKSRDRGADVVLDARQDVGRQFSAEELPDRLRVKVEYVATDDDGPAREWSRKC